MSVIVSIDGATRQIFLNPAAAVSGALSFHAIDDIYREYRVLRRTNESIRRFAPFLRAEGNVAKGGGRFTPRYIVLLSGTKLVIPDAVPTVNVSGEILTDDQTVAFDTGSVSGPVIINYAPPEAEVIAVSSGSGLSPAQDLALSRLLDLAEADEELTQTTATLRKRGTADILLQKNVAGGTITPVELSE